MKILLATTCFLSFTVLAGDTNLLPPLVPAYGELPPTFWEQHRATIFLGGFVLLAFGFLVLRFRLKPETRVSLPPEAVARQALERLQGRPEDGQVLSEASQILRRYFIAAFGLPSREMTTAEFCAALATDDKIGGELAQSVSKLLAVCDQDKFSPKSIVPPVNAVSRVRELISRSEAHLAQLRSVSPPQP
jgi:hypothetical protein